MIRQAINCDMCGAERLESTGHWFVADEIKGEIRLRGWESPQKSRRHALHLCGQKCVQRMVNNFTASILKGQQAGKAAANETASGQATGHDDQSDQSDTPILERMGYDRETIAQVEADSWAGPVKEIPEKSGAKPIKEQVWVNETSTRGEKGFINSTRLKPQPLRAAFQRMA